MEAEWDKDNHGRSSEIFSKSMALGSYLLLDGVVDRLKLPLSLCQEENAQLYFPTEETRQEICVVGSFSALIHAGACQSATADFPCSSVVSLFSVQS